MPGCFVLDVAKLQSWSARQHICRKTGIIPRTKGRARTRETRDFLKTIVAYTRVGDERCYDSRAWNAVAFIHFLLEFSSLTCLLTFTYITAIPFFGCKSHPKLRIHSGLLHQINGTVYQKYQNVYFWARNSKVRRDGGVLISAFFFLVFD